MTDQPSTSISPGLPYQEAQRLAKLGYQAYSLAVGGKAFNGDPLPPWENVPRHIQRAWSFAAVAIAQNTPETRLNGPESAEQGSPGVPGTTETAE